MIQPRQDVLDWFLRTHLKTEKPTVPHSPSFGSGPLPGDQEIIDAMLAAKKNGAAIRSLWEGESPSGDVSADDLALMNHIGFYANYDPIVMERIANSAPRFGRDKWQGREDYRRRTIEKAIEGRDGVGYSWPVEATLRFTGTPSAPTSGTKRDETSPAGDGVASSPDQVESPDGFFNDEDGCAPGNNGVDGDDGDDDGAARVADDAVRFTDSLAGDPHGYWEKRGETWSNILNARILIVQDVTVENGDGTQGGRLMIQGTLADGRVLPQIAVQADEWMSMKWLTANGFLWRQVIPSPGRTTLDKCRTCIQHDSQREGIEQVVVYRSTGWVNIDGEWVFLLAERSIGALGVRDDITVELPPGFEGYVGSEPSSGTALAADFAIWIQLLDVANDDITSVLASAPARAILGVIHPQDAAIYSSGFTGSFKTALQLLILGHFGQFDHPPLNWSGTANAIEGALARLKHVFCSVDDFVPNGSRYDVERKFSDLERVLRNIGNGGGRARMDRFTDLRKAPVAGGLVGITGEDISNSQSAIARAVTLRHDRNQVDLSLLSRLQQANADGVFRRITAAFTQYMAGHWDEVEIAFTEAFAFYRDRYRGKNLGHPRTAEMLAAFAASAQVWFDAFVALGAIDPSTRDTLVARIERGLLITGTAQAETVQEADPIVTFAELLRASISSRRAHFADAETDSEPRQSTRFGWEAEMVRSRDGLEQVSRPKGDRIGWVDYDNDALYLTPAAALGVVQAMGDRTGRRVNLSEKTLGRTLQERGALVSSDPNRTTARISVAGGRQRVWHFRLSHMFPEERREPSKIDVFPSRNREEVA